jgi:hypothetical protein
MTQLLHRISAPTRAALLQNASCLSTTAGSVEAIRHITDEWGGQVNPADAAELDRWWHWASFTVAGKRVGPLLPGVTGKTSAQWRRGISEDSTQSQNRSADS